MIAPAAVVIVTGIVPTLKKTLRNPNTLIPLQRIKPLPLLVFEIGGVYYNWQLNTFDYV